MAILRATAMITQAFQVCPRVPMTRLLQTDARCQKVTATQKMMTMWSCRKSMEPLKPKKLKPLKLRGAMQAQEELFGFETKQTPMWHLSESPSTRPRKRG